MLRAGLVPAPAGTLSLSPVEVGTGNQMAAGPRARCREHSQNVAPPRESRKT